jgi:hypothetical protein
MGSTNSFATPVFIWVIAAALIVAFVVAFAIKVGVGNLGAPVQVQAESSQ